MRAALSVILIGFAGPALAEGVLPIGGVFGDEGGCAFFMTGSAVDDDYMVVTPHTFQSYGTGCRFDALMDTEGGVFTLAATCNSEGEQASTRETMNVIDRGAKGVFIQFEGLQAWGPMLPCPGTAHLFEPSGVLV